MKTRCLNEEREQTLYLMSGSWKYYKLNMHPNIFLW